MDSREGYMQKSACLYFGLGFYYQAQYTERSFVADSIHRRVEVLSRTWVPGQQDKKLPVMSNLISLSIISKDRITNLLHFRKLLLCCAQRCSCRLHTWPASHQPSPSSTSSPSNLPWQRLCCVIPGLNKGPGLVTPLSQHWRPALCL